MWLVGGKAADGRGGSTGVADGGEAIEGAGGGCGGWLGNGIDEERDDSGGATEGGRDECC